MTDKEQIIIDGVDVSGCSVYKNGKCLISKAKCNARCDYGAIYLKEQFARKTQECEELKRKLSNQEQLYQNEIEIYNESCLQLRQENDDLYLERLALNTANSGINSLLEIKEQENDRYRKALEEIEGLISDDEFIRCPINDDVNCNYFTRNKILDIINKAKDGNDE